MIKELFQLMGLILVLAISVILICTGLFGWFGLKAFV